MYLFLEFCVFALPLLALVLITDYFMNYYATLIDVDKVSRKFKSFPAKVPMSDHKNTLYIVTGGAGFIGSWIIRFLILRNENNIISLDTNTTIPADLTKHGVKHFECDLTDKEELQQIIENELNIKDSGCDIVVYHAAVIQRYFLGWFGLHQSVANRNVEMVQSIIDTFTDLSKEIGKPVFIVNISDAITKRKPVNWWKFWEYKSWVSSCSPSNGSRYISSYAKSKAESEAIILEANDNTSLITSSIEPQGIVCGYYGEPLLSPCLYYKGVLNHSGSIPTSFLHVEDVARAALLLETKLRGTLETRDSVAGRSFLVSNGQVERLDTIFTQVKQRMELRIINMNPALVLLVSYVTQLLALVLPSGRKGWRMRDDSLFSGRWWSLTPMRFMTLQLVQMPDLKRIEETRAKLDFTAAFTLEDTVLSTVDDYIRIDKRMDEAKKVRAAQEKTKLEEKRKKALKEKYGIEVDENNNVVDQK